MTSWPLLSVAFFAYVAIAAEWRAPSARARRLCWAGCAGGAVLAIVAFKLSDGIAAGLLLPSAVLLAAYWTTGLLFVAPMPRAERLLAAVDGRLRVNAVANALPRAVAELLEFAYAGIYSLVVLALFFAWYAGMPAERFWSVVLMTDFVCFGMLPWIQTRPPRAVTGDPAWHASFRRVNQRMLDAGSIQVNTFPSGHAAEALAAVLLVIGTGPSIVAFFFVGAIAVSAGAVLGRYHYALDAVVGWVVALSVFYLLPSSF